MQSLRIDKSSIDGDGLFAEREFLPGEEIVEYTGKVLHEDDVKDFSRAYRVDHNDKIYYVVADGFAGYINDTVKFAPMTLEETRRFFDERKLPYTHEPNARFDVKKEAGKAPLIMPDGTVAPFRVVAIAEKKISAGEEITAHYGFQYWGFRFIRNRFHDLRHPVSTFRF